MFLCCFCTYARAKVYRKRPLLAASCLSLFHLRDCILVVGTGCFCLTHIRIVRRRSQMALPKHARLRFAYIFDVLMRAPAGYIPDTALLAGRREMAVRSTYVIEPVMRASKL